jgi:galactokinase
MISMTLTHQTIRQHFIKQFGGEPILVRSPGRINLIGEHTDYNDGFVMPAAIDKEVVFAIAPSLDHISRIFALDLHEHFEIDIQNPQPVSSPLWANYLLGVVRQLVDRKLLLKPFACVFGGNIPPGSGLSSSAALECGFALALQELNSLTISKTEMAKIGQWSEHNFVGVRCGIMDQFANMMGQANQVIQLDCKSMKFQYLPLDLNDHAIVLFNSGVKHSLASSEYNVRRAECEEGVQILKTKYPHVQSLRDASMAMLHTMREKFSDNVFSRCRYVIEEIERVQLAGDDLLRNDLRSFGKRMFETHDGLSRLYQVSCEELDFLVSLVSNNPEILGSRMMGGGFGGCTINIIHKKAVANTVDRVSDAYRQKFSQDIECYTVQTADGTSRILAS